jgi:2-keto-4-pentenoate hydratase
MSVDSALLPEHRTQNLEPGTRNRNCEQESRTRNLERGTVVTEHEVQEAADLLWDHWQLGLRLAALPPAIRPTTRREGYAIQAQLERRSSFPLFGWKLAATSKAGQAHIAVDGPLAGRLLRERVSDSGAQVPFGRNHMRVAEAEFAFRMGADLPPRPVPYSVEEVLRAVDALHPAIELPDSRFQDFTVVGAPQLIADNACAHYFVLGRPSPVAWRAIDLVSHRVTGTVAGKITRDAATRARRSPGWQTSCRRSTSRSGPARW